MADEKTSPGPCPYCRSTLIKFGRAAAGYVMFCGICFAQGPASPSERRTFAVTTWNKASAPASAARLAEAVGLLREALELGETIDWYERVEALLARVDGKQGGG